MYTRFVNAIVNPLYFVYLFLGCFASGMSYDYSKAYAYNLVYGGWSK